MRFKIDENLPVEIAQSLLDKGHDAKTVAGQQLKGIDDRGLVRLCKEENRVLVSLDTDFSNIGAYPPEESSGIIVLRVRNQGKTHVVKVFTRVLSAIEAEPSTNVCG